MSLGHGVHKQRDQAKPNVVHDPLDLRDVEVGGHVHVVGAHVPVQHGVDCWVSETAAVDHLCLVTLGECGNQCTPIAERWLIIVELTRPPWEDRVLSDAGNLLGVVDSQGADGEGMAVASSWRRHRG